jgi:hypothetical protein
MNPDSFFREVLESHEFRLSDILGVFCHVGERILTCPIRQTYWT